MSTSDTQLWESSDDRTRNGTRTARSKGAACAAAEGAHQDQKGLAVLAATYRLPALGAWRGGAPRRMGIARGTQSGRSHVRHNGNFHAFPGSLALVLEPAARGGEVDE